MVWEAPGRARRLPDSERAGGCDSPRLLARAIRHAVLWRKTTNGTQTDAGDRFVERILSIRETCRLNQRPLHAYLVDVHDARLTGQPIPNPLPATQHAA